ncbi:MAG: GFA family protein [Alphaproteobacteria bacterium]|nr:GFA family protein [Alphaproteobacteria bacterium]MCZ6765136.1 GFA family protein [Alphaproteobacteria bacterium]
MTKNIPDPPYEGGCQCGNVRYRVTAKPLSVYTCSCTECQRQAGGAFNMSMLVPMDGLEILKGELETTQRTADSGNKVTGFFCTGCGNRIYHQRENAEVYTLRPGTLDDTKWLNPVAMVWTSSKQAWVQIPEGMRTYEKQPEKFSDLMELYATDQSDA